MTSASRPVDTNVRALVTGASGFVGQHLVALLEAHGDDVIADATDITDRPTLCQSFADAQPELIFHLAAQADVARSWRDPIPTFRVNAEGTLNVLDAAQASGATRVVAVTSADLYGPVDEADLPITESHPLRPVSPYAASKAAADMVCVQAGLASSLEVVRVRAFNHLGPGQSEHFVASAIAQRIAQCERTGTTRVPIGNLQARRDFTDVRDVVRAYRMLAEHGTPGEAYNVCSGIDRSVEDLANFLRERSSSAITFEEDSELLRPVDLPVVRGDFGKIKQATGCTPSISIEATLSDLLDYWRRQEHS